MSPLARRVEEVGRTNLRRMRDPTRITAADFFSDCDALRERFARLVGADDPRSVAVVPSVSYGIAVCARNVALEPGQNVVAARDQFPSNVYAWQRLCREGGGELRVVDPGEGDGSRAERWNGRLLDAVDAATAVVAVAPVQWTDGTRFDLEALGERAREVGAALVVDGTQSVGAVPFDVEKIRPDALVCAGYKWLLGPYSVGMAYFGPRFAEGVPLEETWLGREGSEDFAGLTDYVDAYQPGAIRHDMGERSNPLLVPMQVAALDLVLEWGAEGIQAYCRELTGGLVEEARALGLVVEDPAWRAAHLFGLRLPAGVRPGELQRALAERDVVVSVRGDALRVSPHLYNDHGDVGALIAALREALG